MKIGKKKNDSQKTTKDFYVRIVTPDESKSPIGASLLIMLSSQVADGRTIKFRHTPC